MKYTAAAIALAAFSLSTPALSLPQASDGELPFYVSFWKVPQCARDGSSQVQSHLSFGRDECAHMDYARSFAFRDMADPSAQCSFAFYSDANCTAQVTTPQPRYHVDDKNLILDYYTDCFDDLSSLNNGQSMVNGITIVDNLVPDVYIKTTCH